MTNPVAWGLRVWLIRFLAGRHVVALNLVIRDGGIELQPGEIAVFANVQVHGAKDSAISMLPTKEAMDERIVQASLTSGLLWRDLRGILVSDSATLAKIHHLLHLLGFDLGNSQG